MKASVVALLATSMLLLSCAEAGSYLEWEGSAEGNENESGLFVWQGLDYKWLRTMVGFNTPHRLGPFESRVEKGYVAPSGQVVSRVHQRFDVGVDGDFSHPEVHSTAIASKDLFVSDTLVHRKQLTDSADHGRNPEARTQYVEKVSFENIPAGEYVTILQGLTIGMHCDQAKQDKGDKCNSNGMWPSRMHVDIVDCSRAEGTVTCSVAVDIIRAWTPAKGGLKRFNYKLDLDIQVHLTVVAGAALVDTSVPQDGVSFKGHVHDGDIMDATSGVSQSEKSAPGKSVVGLQGFGFDLVDDSHKKKGRYLQRLAMRVGSAGVSPNDERVEFRSYLGYLAPSTVFASDVEGYVRPVVMQFAPSTRVGNKQVVAKGTVCKSGFGFSCRLKGLEETTEAHIDVVDMPSKV